LASLPSTASNMPFSIQTLSMRVILDLWALSSWSSFRARAIGMPTHSVAATLREVRG
jgi:hypothetical protein